MPEPVVTFRLENLLPRDLESTKALRRWIQDNQHSSNVTAFLEEAYEDGVCHGLRIIAGISNYNLTVEQRHRFVIVILDSIVLQRLIYKAIEAGLSRCATAIKLLVSTEETKVGKELNELVAEQFQLDPAKAKENIRFMLEEKIPFGEEIVVLLLGQLPGPNENWDLANEIFEQNPSLRNSSRVIEAMKKSLRLPRNPCLIPLMQSCQKFGQEPKSRGRSRAGVPAFVW